MLSFFFLPAASREFLRLVQNSFTNPYHSSAFFLICSMFSFNLSVHYFLDFSLGLFAVGLRDNRCLYFFRVSPIYCMIIPFNSLYFYEIRNPRYPCFFAQFYILYLILNSSFALFYIKDRTHIFSLKSFVFERYSTLFSLSIFCY